MPKIAIKKGSVRETLVIPLYARYRLAQTYPELYEGTDPGALLEQVDYDFSEQAKLMDSAFGRYGTLEVAQREFDLCEEARAYLAEHPRAAVVNLGCGLLDLFGRVDNGAAQGYNLDFPEVIDVRGELMPAGERERNAACDLNDFSWMDRIDGSDGSVFFAAGVFYYFKTEEVRAIFTELSRRFPGGVVAFDSCNRTGAKMMTKTWLKGAGIRDVNALFSLDDPMSLKGWSHDFASVSTKSYMRGYRDIYPRVNAFHRLMIRFCESLVRMVIVKITFGEGDR